MSVIKIKKRKIYKIMDNDLNLDKFLIMDYLFGETISSGKNIILIIKDIYQE